MIFKKVNFSRFMNYNMSTSELKKINGGAKSTDFNGPSGDYIDNNGDTTYENDCDEVVYNEDECK